MNKMNYQEFNSIINPVLGLDDYQKLKGMRHHGISRYDHSYRVAYYTYMVTKFFHLNYNEATFAAILHDFFTTEVKEKNVYLKLSLHPNIAINNSKKHFDLTELEEDIIRCHMFPVTFRPPRYLESWIVDMIDDFVAIYEWGFSFKKEFAAVLAIFIQFIRLR